MKRCMQRDDLPEGDAAESIRAKRKDDFFGEDLALVVRGPQGIRAVAPLIDPAGTSLGDGPGLHTCQEV